MYLTKKQQKQGGKGTLLALPCEKKTRVESSRSAAAVAWEAGAEDEIEDTMSISQ